MLQLFQQHLLIIAGKLMALPVNSYRGLLLRVRGRGIVAFPGALGFCRAAGEDFHFIPHPDHAAVTGNQVLTKVDIAIILRGAEAL